LISALVRAGDERRWRRRWRRRRRKEEGGRRMEKEGKVTKEVSKKEYRTRSNARNGEIDVRSGNRGRSASGNHMN